MKKPPPSIESLRELAERGDGLAANDLGDLYREGSGGLRQSPSEAFRWYARSALAGCAVGQNNVGACYEHGIGCKQSYRNALAWYRKSAAQRTAYASSNIAYCYQRGHGVRADKALALAWFEKALAEGDARAAAMIQELRGDMGADENRRSRDA